MTTEDLFTLGAIVLLLFLSGFFSGSETALTAASRARVHRMARDGNKRAQTVDKLIEDRESLIGTILLGNNAVNILATSLATVLFAKVFGDYAVAAASLIMTVLVLIFAEVMPKTFAISNADRAALLVGPFIRALVPILSPITRAVQSIVRLTLRLFGVDTSKSDHALSIHEEIRGTIDLHEKEGTGAAPDKLMLGGILDLDELEVLDVMVHRRNMEMIDADLNADTIIERAVLSPHTRIPLWRADPDNIIGILHAKDLLRAVRAKGEAPIDIMSLMVEPWFVPETTTLREQLNAFRDRRAHFALVVDEYGALMGLVTLEDILEEIVGEITDEHDIGDHALKSDSEGRVTAEGTVPIRDLNREFDWSLSDEHATTIAGFVIHEAQTIPDPGQTFLFDGFKFEVLQKRRNQITLLRITPPAQEVQDDVGEDEDG